MYQHLCMSVGTLVLLVAAVASTAHAQSDQDPPIDQSYELSLQVVIGTNDGGAGPELPSNLSGISRQLKNNFRFSNYRLIDTFFSRISNTGNVEYKNVGNMPGHQPDAESNTFLEWAMTDFRVVPKGFRARSFRFGARVPVRTGSFRDGANVANPVVSYEAVGLTMNMLGLPADTPTLIGTISLPKTSGTIFLVATVRAAGI